MKYETIENPISYCLCTLAFGQSYRMAAKELASKAAESGIRLTVATDDPEDFKDHSNVTTVSFTRTSIWKPYNDKRFAVAAALKDHECVILVDADSNILAELPKKINVEPGMTAHTAHKSLEEDLIQYHPQDLKGFRQLAKKLNIDLAQVKWVAENIVIIRRDSGKEWQFLDTWAFADQYLGIRKVFQGDHGFIGVSAAVVGWQVRHNDDFNQLKSIIKNIGRHKVGKTTKKSTYLTKIKSRITYYYRYYRALFDSLMNYHKYWS